MKMSMATYGFVWLDDSKHMDACGKGGKLNTRRLRHPIHRHNTPPLSQTQTQSCFVPFAVVLALTLLFTAFYLPETLGRTVQARHTYMCLCMHVCGVSVIYEYVCVCMNACVSHLRAAVCALTQSTQAPTTMSSPPSPSSTNPLIPYKHKQTTNRRSSSWPRSRTRATASPA